MNKTLKALAAGALTLGLLSIQPANAGISIQIGGGYNHGHQKHHYYGHHKRHRALSKTSSSLQSPLLSQAL